MRSTKFEVNNMIGAVKQINLFGVIAVLVVSGVAYASDLSPTKTKAKVRVGEVFVDGIQSSSGSVSSIDQFVAERPQLRVDRIANYVGNKITISSNHFRYSENGIDTIDNHWQIVDEDGNEIISQQGQYRLEWTPEAAGTFTVRYTITENDLEASVTEKIYVLNKVDQETDIFDLFWTMSEKIIGTWSGEILSQHGDSTHVTAVFYDDGTYVISRLMRTDHYPPFPPYPIVDKPYPVDFYPIPPPGIHYDEAMGFRFPHEPYSGLSFINEAGNFELLDIWANGEALGYMYPTPYAIGSTENMKQIRFTDDYDMMFFNIAKGEYYYGETETYVLSRISEFAEPPSLEVIREQLNGEWRGTVMTPWATPYEVEFEFDVEGGYTASSIGETMLYDGEAMGVVSPLYFGAKDQNMEINQVELSDFEDGKVSGEISLSLKNGDVVKGTISDMEMAIDYSVVVFTFQHYGKYGPIQYVLEKQ